METKSGNREREVGRRALIEVSSLFSIACFLLPVLLQAQSGGSNFAILNSVRYAVGFASGSSQTGGIQEALNDLPATGGKVMVTAPVTMSEGVTLKSKSNIEIECAKGATIAESTAGVQAFYLSSVNAVSIHGCTLVGPGTASAAWGTTAIYVDDDQGTPSAYIRIFDNRFTGWGYSPIVVVSDDQNVNHLWIERNEFAENDYAGSDEVGAITLFGQSTTHSGQCPTADCPVEDYWIRDNRIEGTSAAIASATRASNVVTINTVAAHDLQAGESVQVCGVVYGGATGFNSSCGSAAASYFTVVSVPSSTVFTYSQSGEDGSASANTGGVFYQTQKYGILIEQNTSSGVVAGNIISGALWHGIVLTNEVNTAWTQPTNRQISISGNQVLGCGHVGIYIQSPGEGVVVAHDFTSGNSFAQTNSIEGGYYLFGGRASGTVTMIGNTSVGDFYEGMHVAPSVVTGAGAPANGGFSLNAAGLTVVNPNQSGQAPGGVTISLAGSPSYFGHLNLTGLTVQGDGTHGASVYVCATSACGAASGWRGLSFSGATLHDASFQLEGQSGISDIAITGGRVTHAPASAVFADTVSGLTISGVLVRDYNTSAATGGGILLNHNVTNFTVTGNTIVQTQPGTPTEEYGLWIADTSDTPGLLAGNFVTGARTCGSCGNYHLAPVSGLQEYADSDGNFTSSGDIKISPANGSSITANGNLTVTGNTSSTVSAAVNNSGTGVAALNLQTSTSNYPQVQFTRGSGLEFQLMDRSGALTVYDNLNSAYRLWIASDGNVGIGTTSISSGQKLEVNGGIALNTATAQPACSSTTRGTFWVMQGAGGVKDSVQVCAKDQSDSYSWRTIY